MYHSYKWELVARLCYGRVVKLSCCFVSKNTCQVSWKLNTVVLIKTKSNFMWHSLRRNILALNKKVMVAIIYWEALGYAEVLNNIMWLGKQWASHNGFTVDEYQLLPTTYWLLLVWSWGKVSKQVNMWIRSSWQDNVKTYTKNKYCYRYTQKLPTEHRQSWEHTHIYY